MIFVNNLNFEKVVRITKKGKELLYYAHLIFILLFRTNCEEPCVKFSTIFEKPIEFKRHYTNKLENFK